jgi:nucleotide-binding universal stress UspA family protein
MEQHVAGEGGELVFTRILVAVDTTGRADDAVAAARTLAERFDSHLVLLQVATWPAYLLDLAAAQARLDRHAALLRGCGLSVTTVVRDDIAEDGIAAVAREESADLIVLAPHRRMDHKRLAHILRPSVSSQMLSHAPIPFLIVPEPPHTAHAIELLAALGPQVGPIMLALDGSECAEQAIPVATGLARRLRQRLVLVRVVSGEALMPLTDAQLGARRIAMQSLLEDEWEAHEYVAAIRRGLVAAGNVKVQTRVVCGDVVEKLLEVAEAENACALVVATHGRGGLARMLIGSVAADLVQRTTLPLVVVPPIPTTDLPEGGKTK